MVKSAWIVRSHLIGLEDNGIVDFGYKKHFRVYHGGKSLPEKAPISMALNHFEAMPKQGLVKPKEINKNVFILHLRKCEFRFNNCD